MPNIANLFKSEMARIARRELRTETQALKKAVGTYRSEIATLKRRTQALEQQVRRLGKGGGAAAEPAAQADVAEMRRFSAKGLAAQRRRLGLSAADCGLLVGASSQSVYNWEDGKVRPRRSHMPAIAALRAMGKREVAARLAALKGE